MKMGAHSVHANLQRAWSSSSGSVSCRVGPGMVQVQIALNKETQNNQMEFTTDAAMAATVAPDLTCERSRNTVLVMSTQVHYLSHRTVQYGTHSCISSQHIRSADSSESGSASRVARSSVATSCTYVSTINASKCIQRICCV